MKRFGIEWLVAGVVGLSGCARPEPGFEPRFDQEKRVILIGNDGLHSNELARLGERLAAETGVLVAIEPTPHTSKTEERLRQATAEGVTVLLIGYSAGCRDIITVLENTRGRARLFMIEPTYQSTIGYVRVPVGAISLVSFRIAGGSPLTFSGREYRVTDFVSATTRYENVSLTTRSHSEACSDPGVYKRLLAELTGS